MSSQNMNARITLRELQKRYRAGERLTMLTAYDAVTAQLLDEAGVEMVLVGDSLGNVVLGYDTTLPVKLEDMIRHTQAVMRGTLKSFVILDLPFGTTTDPETALKAAVRAMQETGCHAVKLEGGLHAAEVVKRLTEQGIPVVAHIGLTPQSIHQLGGYYRHGKTDQDARALVDAAKALEAAGAFAIVLECIVESVAAEITRKLEIPTIGIGSGPDCSGQVLVINDLIGLGVKPAPKFARPRAQVADIIRKAAHEYVQELKNQEQACRAGSSSTSETLIQ